MDAATIVGTTAAVLTTLSNLPQLIKCWRTRSAEDLSLRTFLALTTGLALWIGYGVLKGDWIIMLSNVVGLCLCGGILYWKLRGAKDPSLRSG
jgi:MtN3 and saliva related transmembrane protein